MQANDQPKESDKKSFKYRGTVCLNCEQPLDKSDVFCPYCSQRNKNEQLTFWGFLAEFANSQIVYDIRLRNTLRDLLFRPGRMTRNYIKGQRLKYANPFRFFLSVSIIYFIMQGLVETFIADPLLDVKKETSAVNPELRTLFSRDSTEQANGKKYITEVGLDSLSGIESFIKRFKTYELFYNKNKTVPAVTALAEMGHPNTRFNRWLYNKNPVIEKIQNNPKEFINYLLRKTPFFIFFFTPFYTLFYLLLYSRKKYAYSEHVIFNYHIFSFLFLAMMVFLIPDAIMGTDFFIGLLFLIIGPFYFYKALRNFYVQGRLKTLLKFVFLSWIFFISATFAALLFFSVYAVIY